MNFSSKFHKILIFCICKLWLVRFSGFEAKFCVLEPAFEGVFRLKKTFFQGWNRIFSTDFTHRFFLILSLLYHQFYANFKKKKEPYFSLLVGSFLYIFYTVFLLWFRALFKGFLKSFSTLFSEVFLRAFLGWFFSLFSDLF